MRKYDFNENGVCVNPNMIEYSVKNTDYRIKTAKDKHGGWRVGYAFHFFTNGNGVCVPCSCRSRERFVDEKEAIKYAADKGLEFFSGKFQSGVTCGSYLAVPNDIIVALRHLINPRPIQLSLF